MIDGVVRVSARLACAGEVSLGSLRVAQGVRQERSAHGPATNGGLGASRVLVAYGVSCRWARLAQPGGGGGIPPNWGVTGSFRTAALRDAAPEPPQHQGSTFTAEPRSPLACST